MMEGLIELVAASFVRHGIEVPDSASQSVPQDRTFDPTPPTALPEHSYRKKLDSDPAT